MREEVYRDRKKGGGVKKASWPGRGKKSLNRGAERRDPLTHIRGILEKEEAATERNWEDKEDIIRGGSLACHLTREISNHPVFFLIRWIELPTTRKGELSWYFASRVTSRRGGKIKGGKREGGGKRRKEE